MKVFASMAISASALSAEKLRIDTISQNVANINTTRTPEGGPYQRRRVVFSEMLQESKLNRFVRLPSRGGTDGAGVQVSAVIRDEAPARMVHDPSHPDADEDGYVAMPNIDVVNEMVDLITASRAYETNVQVLNVTKSLAMKALEIGRG
ncbi:MAG: flagellar basal-body rod protein FlgC [Bacillota bacterium]|nr:MAG: flagellar basal-body rod protein FlgC [Bacillota bacterium]MBS3951271.1 flagellar basal body rod protein FlgC [Peptococcaceae bacterium]